MNSWRSKVKAAIYSEPWKRDEFQDENVLNGLKVEVADAVFDALGIVEDEQDMAGGYFLLHGGIKVKAVITNDMKKVESTSAMRLPLEWREFKKALAECGYLTMEEVTRIYFTCGDTSLAAVLGSCKLLNIVLSDTIIDELRKVL